MIIGDQKLLEKVRASHTGDPSILVSLEALEHLPDLWDGVVVQVPFVPPESDKLPGDFAPVGGGKYMPSVDLMNKIAEARGICGLDMAIVEPVYEDIDWNIMAVKLDDPPKLVRDLVGYRCTLQGKVLAEDGTERYSQPCTVIYNAWERVCELFTKEEQYSDGYKTPTQYPPKYAKMGQRRAAFQSELKFAARKAESKARNVVIRSLCGMPTGYTAEQLKAGFFAFGKIVRSSWAVKAEYAARLQALSHGIGDHTASAALFGPADSSTPPDKSPDYTATAVTETPDDTPEYTATQDLASQAAKPQELTRDSMLAKLRDYQTKGLVPADQKQAVENIVAWLDKTPDAVTNIAFWDKAKQRLQSVEDAINRY